MEDLIQLTRWDETFKVGDPVVGRAYCINPKYIVEINELPPEKRFNFSSRTRIITFIPSAGSYCVEVLESAEEIKKLAMKNQPISTS